MSGDISGCYEEGGTTHRPCVEARGAPELTVHRTAPPFKKDYPAPNGKSGYMILHDANK